MSPIFLLISMARLFILAGWVRLGTIRVSISVWTLIVLVLLGHPVKQRRDVLTQRVVEQRLDLAAAVALLLEVDLQQILQYLPLHDVRDAFEEHRPRTHGHLRLKDTTPSNTVLRGDKAEPVPSGRRLTSRFVMSPLMNGDTLTLCIVFFRRTSWCIVSASPLATGGMKT